MSVISLNAPATQQSHDTKLKASTWVKLRELPSPYSHDEALLLCKTEDGFWIAWIPDYGEIKLSPRQILGH
ncbi:hypothetical protein C7H19_04225 [Aphanothece hegewaldii CCALA 016]|uniref:Uncharacterized protein n=1 Tax=Aphanothece hegewaldii CCALA 016 TaxID=2107694 RepID=A0A2T1M1Z2_9CHRO|nr:hypothetical protein [Aphanothece hegewaldii]PSF38721.1 hypothetical protein C7H19_04225 [Aphanothece hegewaldii CCALA 016]